MYKNYICVRRKCETRLWYLHQSSGAVHVIGCSGNAPRTLAHVQMQRNKVYVSRSHTIDTYTCIYTCTCICIYTCICIHARARLPPPPTTPHPPTTHTNMHTQKLTLSLSLPHIH